MRPRSLPSIRFLFLTTLVVIGCGVVACSDDDGGDSTVTLGPPSLEIVGFQASDGESFKADADVVTLCTDGKLAVTVGPSETSPGQLDNWFLRPPGGCGNAKQCGYVVATVTSKNGKESVSASSASINIPLDLSGLTLSGEYTLRVELQQGNTGEPFLLNGEPVTDQVTLSFDEHACAAAGGAGGGGGAGGETGLGGAGGALGGLGGLGGGGLGGSR